VANIHHFAYGWVNPVLAYVLSFLGSLLGLVLTARSRDTNGNGRLRWLFLAALAIGGTGIWLMHFMAMLGFDVPDSTLRFDIVLTVASFGVAVAIVALGLIVAALAKPSLFRIVAGGLLTGVGVAAMHYMGMAAVRLGGSITYDPWLVTLSVCIAVVASVVALWFAVVIRGAGATVGAAALMGVAVCSMHYTGMAAVRVRLEHQAAPIEGVSPFVMLAPISVISCIVISALAYATIGFSMRQEGEREDELLTKARDLHGMAAMLQLGGARHR